MNQERLTDKQREEWGKPIPGSKYIRDFCSECGEPIRVFSGKVLEDNFCTRCDGHLIRGRRFSCDIRHTRDYDNPDGDSGFVDFSYPSDGIVKKISPRRYSDEA